MLALHTPQLRGGDVLARTATPAFVAYALEAARCCRVCAGDRLAGHPLAQYLPRKSLLLYIPEQFYQNNIIFIHIPKNAGTSISMALYGARHDHRPAHFYQNIDPVFFSKTPSFAMVRNPYERTLSSFCFLRNGGGSHVGLSAFWRHRARGIADLDDYLYWVKDLFAKGAMLDFTMRQQSEFVLDKKGRIIVSNLFLLQDNQTRLRDFLLHFGVVDIPRLNTTPRLDISITSRQKSMIEKLYETDFVLFEGTK